LEIKKFRIGFFFKHPVAKKEQYKKKMKKYTTEKQVFGYRFLKTLVRIKMFYHLDYMQSSTHKHLYSIGVLANGNSLVDSCFVANLHTKYTKFHETDRLFQIKGLREDIPDRYHQESWHFEPSIIGIHEQGHSSES
jgi:hypothetical protein